MFENKIIDQNAPTLLQMWFLLAYNIMHKHNWCTSFYSS